MAVKAGTFDKSVAAAPCTQAVTGIGFPLKALILWTVGATAEDTYQAHIVMGAGFSIDGTSYSAAAAAEDNVATTDTTRYMQTDALSIVDYDDNILARASLLGIGDDSFSLSWTVNNAVAYKIHYLAIGGDDLTDVALVEWALPAAIGDVAVATVGFQPDLVLHLSDSYSAHGVRNTAASISLGAMDASGNQFSIGYTSLTGLDAARSQGINDPLYALSAPGGGFVPGHWYGINFVSMDANGFTVHENYGLAGIDILVASLCFKGGDYAVGSSNEPGGAVNQTVNVGFPPEGVLFLGGCAPSAGPAHAIDEGKACVGGYDGTTCWAGTFHSQNGADPTDANVYDSISNVLSSVYTDPPAGPDAEVTPVGLGATTFTVHWSADVAGVTILYGYVAFDTGPYTPTFSPDVRSAHRPPLTYSLVLKRPGGSPSLGSPAVWGGAPSLAAGVSFQDITDLARNWTRSVRLQGGFWTGTFSIPLCPRAFDAFDTWLGAHVEERSGGAVTWEGLVYEMELSRDGLVRRRSFDDMANAVRTDYTDYTGTATQTAWAYNLASVIRYGEKQEILDSDTELPGTAEMLRDRYLAEHGWAWEKAAAISTNEGLTVTVCGYSFTANWLHTTWDDEIVMGGLVGYAIIGGNSCFYKCGWGAADWAPYIAVGGRAIATLWTTDVGGVYHWGYIGTTVENVGCGDPPGTQNSVEVFQDQQLTTNGWNGVGAFNLLSCLLRRDVTEFVRDTLNDCQWLIPGNLDLMDSQVDRTAFDYQDSPTRCWDAIQQCVGQGDSQGNPWRAYVDVNRRLYLAQVSTTPRYYFRDGRWFGEPSGSPINPWQMRPAVCRALSDVYSAPRTGYWLTDPRDFLVEEFEVNQDGMVTPRITEVSSAETFLYYLNQLQGFTRPEEPSAGPLPPNWDVEHNRPNPRGPNGDIHGYWAVENGIYIWVHDPNITLASWYNPATGAIDYE